MSAYLPKTKNGRARTVPLCHEAMKLVEYALEHGGKDRLFMLSPYSISQAFGRAATRAGYPELVFHDTRHEGISRLFEMGLSVLEVARISGHRTLSQLDRYTHLDIGHLGRRLRGEKAA